MLVVLAPLSAKTPRVVVRRIGAFAAPETSISTVFASAETELSLAVIVRRAVDVLVSSSFDGRRARPALPSRPSSISWKSPQGWTGHIRAQ